MPIRNVFEHTKEISKSIENLEVEDLQKELEANSDLLLLDIREIQELVLKGTIPKAKHVPRGMLEFWADPNSPYARDYFKEDARIVVFCAGGGRSVYAVKALEEMGFQDVAHLASGFGGWEKAGGEIDDYASRSKWVQRDESP